MSLKVFRDRLVQSLNKHKKDSLYDRLIEGLELAISELDAYIKEQCMPGDKFYEDAISLARKRIGYNEVDGEDLQVDDDAEFSETDDGQWVQSWLFLSNEDILKFQKEGDAKRR